MSFLRFVIFFMILIIAHWGFASSIPCNVDPLSQTRSETDSKKNDKILLRYKFRTYEILRFTAEEKSVIEGNREGVRELTSHESKFKKHFRVVHVDAEGSALIEPVLDQVNMRLQFGKEKPIIFDSTSKEEVPAKFKNVNAIIGKELIQMRISSTGKLLKSIALIANASLKKSLQKKNGELFNNDPSKNFVIMLPKQAKKPGEQWTDRSKKISLEVNPGLKRTFTILRTYQLESVDNNVAKISFVSAINPPIRSPELQAQVIQLLTHGSIYFDIGRGRILEKTTIVDNHIVGLLNGTGSMHVKTRRTERLVEPSTASKVSSPK